MGRDRGNRRGGRFRGSHGRGRGGNFNKSNGPPRSRVYKHFEQSKEEDVGITEFCTDMEGYSAVIKSRFSDFQVNEIDMLGNIAKLTDTSMPKQFQEVANTTSYKDQSESPIALIPQDTWNDIIKLVADTETDNNQKAPVLMDGTALTKDDRREVHTCVKKYFGKDIVASTISKDDKTFMEFKIWDKKDKNDRLQWAEGCPEYVHFLVYKEMADTNEACFKIARALNIAPSKLTYAGVKDKRGKTTQWFCVRKYHPSRLLARCKKLRNITIGNIQFHDTPLKIGQLKGNRFRVALRNVLADDEMINKSLENLKENGFINYYGMQRFGKDKEVPTYLVGIKLLKGEWREAIDLILKPKASDDPTEDINYAKKIYARNGDASEALKACKHSHNSVEKKLLEGLSNHQTNDLVCALEAVPRNMRLMYIHAFQSLIWNKLVSRRIKEFGLKPVEGDLVLVGDVQEESLVTEDDEEKEEDGIEQDKKEEEEVTTSRGPAVKALTADELDKYTIFDIVLPLPGYDIVYPENLKQYYKDEIESFGLNLEMPQQKVRAYNLSGTYRRMVQRAEDLEWQIVNYKDPSDNLIRSDFEELKGEEEPKTASNGQYKGLVLSFTLKPASYATMVLREFLKCSTTTGEQAKLNDYGKKKIIVQNENRSSAEDTGSLTDQGDEHSLLNNKEKFEYFKNAIFKDILEETDSSKKRPLGNEDAEGEHAKKVKSSEVPE